MKRRDVLKALAVAGGAVAVFKTFGKIEVMAQTMSGKPQASQPWADLTAALGGEPEQMLDKALAEMGGLERFVKKGQKVVLKPNIGWDKTPEQAANTNPLLLSALIRRCFVAGASEVQVFDHTCDEWSSCYQNSGLEEAAKQAGAKVIPAHEESYYRTVQLPAGKVLREAKVHRALLDCDVWLNVPVLKHHGGANLTMSMKNFMGIVWDRKFFHRNDLQQCIADICTLAKRPVLNIVDAYRVIRSNGPRGRSAEDVVTAKALFVSGDIVAVDTAAARFFSQIHEMSLSRLPYLQYGQELGLGTMDIDSLQVKRIRL